MLEAARHRPFSRPNPYGSTGQEPCHSRDGKEIHSKFKSFVKFSRLVYTNVQFSSYSPHLWKNLRSYFLKRRKNRCTISNVQAPFSRKNQLEPIDYAFVLASASAHSDYSKFDPYLFNTTGTYPHNKEKLFNAWGYTVDDAQWLQAEFAQQAREKYLSGNYALGMLNKFGQRINIEIELPRRDKVGIATFISGWMVAPNGRLNLIAPYGGK